MVKLYVEGAGDTAVLKTECRASFTAFMTKTGIKKRPRVVACGSRTDAYEAFCIAIKKGQDALLLVDSEQPVNPNYQKGGPDTWQPWAHLKARDKWIQPQHSADSDCHLMVQSMENWFLADRDALKAFFGQGFNGNLLPSTPVEDVAAHTLHEALKKATHACKTKSRYDKSNHSFKLLAAIDPEKVMQASAWGKRFVDELRKKMEA